MAFVPPKPTPKGLWRRTPPAIFPPTLGLLGLGLGWRQGVGEFGLPPGLADAFLGGVTLLALFALLSYLVKLMRRPGAGLEDLRILPGRAGLAAAVLCLYLLAAVIGPFSAPQARPILIIGIAAHLLVTVAVVRALASGPAEQRRVNPVWHLLFSGWVVAALVAGQLALPMLATGLFWLALLAAVAIWTLSLQQFSRETVPAPLRPLLAIHLAPAALFASVAGLLGYGTVAQGFALFGAVILLALLLAGRWIAETGFSPLWGAFTFPLTAFASSLVLLGGWYELPGLILALVALGAVPAIAWKVLKLWPGGKLAGKTNAAEA